jgi:hypothetical protein
MNFKILCEWAEKGYLGSIKNTNLLLEMDQKEIEQLDSHGELPVDNEKYMEYWFKIKRAVIQFRGRSYGVIGSHQFIDLIAPLHSEVFGQCQR